MILFEVQTIST